MTTAERIGELFGRVPVETDGTRNILFLNFIVETAERVAKNTATTDAGITFTFRDDSRLTYNAQAQAVRTTRPISHAAIEDARNYILEAIANRRRPCAA